MKKFNGWRSMWVMATFDLPTQTISQKRHYNYFRNLLLENGFTMMQFSVYIRNMPTQHKAEALIKRLGVSTPEEGRCAFIQITDKQYAMIKNYYGSKERKEKILEKYEQLVLFED
jgi:CRISPR-associated protein Cas2